MKNVKYLFILIIWVGNLSCGKNFDDLNVDPNNPVSVPADFLLTSAQKSMADQMCGIDQVYTGFIWGQYFSLNNYTDDSRYILNIQPANYRWSWYYAQTLYDLNEILRLVREKPGLDISVDRNKIAIAKILMVFRYHEMTDLFGPIPYSEALQGASNRTPKYDSQKDIYFRMLSDLREAVAMLDESKESFGNADIIYRGDVSKWKKFANSLRLRIAMRMSDVEMAKAQAEVEAAFAGAFHSNDDNAYFYFLTGSPNNNTLNQFRIERIDADFGLSNILIDKTLIPLNDPRLSVFADEKVNGGGYAGRPYGQNSGNAASESPDKYSQPSGSKVIREGGVFRKYDLIAPDAVGRFMSYAEVCFILAEAVERGWSIPGTANEWYNKGITASLEEWGISTEAINAYLSQTSVNYLTAFGDWKQKIGVQKWIALFLHGNQGWIEWRRLDFEKLELPVDGVIQDVGVKVAPVRWAYPINEQIQNSASYQAGLVLLGGPDKLTTRLWWDVQ